MEVKMKIEKNGIIYTVKEYPSAWTLKAAINGVDVSYNVSKVDCPTFEELTAFIIKK